MSRTTKYSEADIMYVTTYMCINTDILVYMYICTHVFLHVQAYDSELLVRVFFLNELLQHL